RQSPRNASTGFTRAARRAGIQLAANDSATSSTTAPASDIGSVGATSNRNERRNRPAKNTSTSPTTSPAPQSASPRAATDAATDDGCAPSAMRTPISRVRSDTMYAITAYSPTMLSTSVAAAAAPSTIIVNVSCAVDAVSVSCID